MTTPSTPQGNMLRAHADIADYSSRGDFTAQYLRDAAGIIDAQAEEIELLRSIHQDIGGIGGCADGSGMRAVAAVADANKRADKAEDHVADLEEALERISQLSFYDGADFCHPEGCEAPRIARAVLSKRSAE